MAVRPGGEGCPMSGAGWQPLSEMELEHLSTRAAVPFRDLSGTGTTDEILTRRKIEQDCCDLEPTNCWQRRWGLLKKSS